MRRRALTAFLLAVGILASLGGCEAAQAAHNNATCGAMAKQCLSLYSGGKVVKSFKDPQGVSPVPGGGVAFMDGQGRPHMWFGDFLLRG